jgi:hypothetical protein
VLHMHMPNARLKVESPSWKKPFSPSCRCRGTMLCAGGGA